MEETFHSTEFLSMFLYCHQFMIHSSEDRGTWAKCLNLNWVLRRIRENPTDYGKVRNRVSNLPPLLKSFDNSYACYSQWVSFHVRITSSYLCFFWKMSRFLRNSRLEILTIPWVYPSPTTMVWIFASSKIYTLKPNYQGNGINRWKLWEVMKS